MQQDVTERYRRLAAQTARLVDAFAEGAMSIRTYTKALGRLQRVMRPPSRGARKHARRVKAAQRRGAR